MIPEGYRLLTPEDVDKVFGVDFSLEVYIDTETMPEFSPESNINWTNFIQAYLYFDEVADIEVTKYNILNNEVYNGFTWVVNNLYTITNNTKVESFNTDYTWNTWFYVKDNPYNITSSKPKITINCKGKLMASDLTITRALWDGSYEEISNGYTLTLEITTDALNNELYTYSINNGVTFNQFTNSNMVLENVSKIIIKNDASIYAIGIEYFSGSVIGGVAGGTQGEFIIEEDTQWCISLGKSGGAN